jgi:hypothetical protein
MVNVDAHGLHCLSRTRGIPGRTAAVNAARTTFRSGVLRNQLPDHIPEADERGDSPDVAAMNSNDYVCINVIVLVSDWD